MSATVLALLLPLPDEAWLLVALMVAGGPVVGSLWVPGMALVSHAARRWSAAWSAIPAAEANAVVAVSMWKRSTADGDWLASRSLTGEEPERSPPAGVASWCGKPPAVARQPAPSLACQPPA